MKTRFTFSALIAATVILVGGLASAYAQMTNPIDGTPVILTPGEVTVEKTADTSTAAPGESVEYSIRVTNVGSVNVLNPVIADTLPKGMTFAEYGGQAYEFTPVDTLAPGDHVSVTYMANIKPGVGDGTYTNIAVVSANNMDAVKDSVDVEVVTPDITEKPGTPILSVLKSAAIKRANPGGTVDYTVGVANDGDATALNVTLDDILPGGFVFIDTGGSTRTWSLGDLEPGQHEVITYSVTVPTDAAEVSFDNTAIASAENAESAQDNETVSVVKPEVLGVIDEDTTSGGEVLAETGAGTQDILIAFGALIVAVGAAVGSRRLIV